MEKTSPRLYSLITIFALSAAAPCLSFAQESSYDLQPAPKPPAASAALSYEASEFGQRAELELALDRKLQALREQLAGLKGKGMGERHPLVIETRRALEAMEVARAQRSYTAERRRVVPMTRPPFDGRWKIGIVFDPVEAGKADDGIKVRSVEPGQAAEKAGIRAGDVLVSVNEILIRDPMALTLIINIARDQELEYCVRREVKVIGPAGKNPVQFEKIKIRAVDTTKPPKPVEAKTDSKVTGTVVKVVKEKAIDKEISSLRKEVGELRGLVEKLLERLPEESGPGE